MFLWNPKIFKFKVMLIFMLEEKITIISPEEAKKFHFNVEKGKCFPPSCTGDGIITKYNPSDFERKHCGYAPGGYDCSTARAGPIGGKLHTPTCAECPYHSSNRLIG